jgi:hypothetical protein
MSVIEVRIYTIHEGRREEKDANNVIAVQPTPRSAIQ